MRAQTRHQLKQDRFAETVYSQVSWANENRKTLVIAAAAVIALVAIGAGAWYINGRHNLAASAMLGDALHTYQTPITAPGTPAEPGEQAFTSVADRGKASLAQFSAVVDKYGSTTSGRIARYWVGISYRDMGDYADAEKSLKRTADEGNRDLSSLARSALGDLYASQHRDKEAEAAYKALVDHPSSLISKAAGELQLAQFYEDTKNVNGARTAYQQIVKEEPKSELGQLATSKLATLK